MEPGGFIRHPSLLETRKARLASGENLILEVKGQDLEQDQVKRRFLDEWVKAVNEHGGFGAWAWEVSKNPGDIKELLAKHAQPPETASGFHDSQS